MDGVEASFDRLSSILESPSRQMESTGSSTSGVLITMSMNTPLTPAVERTPLVERRVNIHLRSVPESTSFPGL